MFFVKFYYWTFIYSSHEAVMYLFPSLDSRWKRTKEQMIAVVGAISDRYWLYISLAVAFKLSLVFNRSPPALRPLKVDFVILCWIPIQLRGSKLFISYRAGFLLAICRMFDRMRGHFRLLKFKILNWNTFFYFRCLGCCCTWLFLDNQCFKKVFLH